MPTNNTTEMGNNISELDQDVLFSEDEELTPRFDFPENRFVCTPHNFRLQDKSPKNASKSAILLKYENLNCFILDQGIHYVYFVQNEKSI